MKKTGFTLIELLAVIVILAIIALIAVPIVINVINDSKEESIKKSINLYIDTAEKTITQENLKTKYNPDECIIQKDGNLICSEKGNELTTSNGTNILKVEIKGSMPTSGILQFSDGKIVKGTEICTNDNYYSYDSTKKISLIKEPTLPGLYDENYELLVTWDELVNTYNLDLTKNYTSSTYTGKGSLYYALKKNTNLKQNGKILIISDSVEKIGNYALYNCNNISSIIIPSNVTSIGTSAFSNCKKITSITFKNNSKLTNIGTSAFKSCIRLISITLPKSVTSISSSAFSGCTALTNITIPSSVTSIGGSAFSGCSNLTDITLPNSITSIENSTFEGCKNLKKIVIPNSVISIGGSAFSGCTALTNITIPNSVTSIGSSAFFNCSSLTNISIPDSVTIIENQTFQGCNNLTNITIPSNVTRIGYGAFKNCANLNKIEFAPNSHLTTLGNDGSDWSTIEILAGGVFEDCNNLTSIVIPSSVTIIGASVFYGSNLQRVTFENSENWYIFDSANETSGTNIDVTNSSTNAANLKNTYLYKYWKRN